MSAADDNLNGRSILIVDDHEPHRTLLANYLGGLGCRCVGAGGGHEALARLAVQNFDLVLLDLRMDDLDGMEVLKRARAQGLLTNCIMMSAEGTISHAVDAIRLGAKDFLIKPFELEQLHEMVCQVLGTHCLGGADARDPRLLWRDEHVPDMIGEHPTLLEVFLVLERIAGTDCTVLVLGESGTGKELVARALHHASLRHNKPFVPVNCGAIPQTLIESELFGHAKGAFSGATQAREGRFAVADGGTLFLDEIGEMSLSVQVTLLRVLQEHEFVPVGETRPRKCDVRIIAATNRNLESMAAEGTFREDLFYRLNLIPIHLPPLRDRLSDVPALARHFLERASRPGDRTVLDIKDEVLETMMRYPWPGNVRELENTVQRMALLHHGHGTIDVSDLPPRVVQEARRASSVGTAMPSRNGLHVHASEAPAASQGAVLPIRPDVRPPGHGPGETYTHAASAVVRGAAAAAPAIEAAEPLVAVGSSEPMDEHQYMVRLPDEGIDLREVMHRIEMDLIDQALARTGNNRNQAARLLRMNRTTLVERLRRKR